MGIGPQTTAFPIPRAGEGLQGLVLQIQVAHPKTKPHYGQGKFLLALPEGHRLQGQAWRRNGGDRGRDGHVKVFPRSIDPPNYGSW